ncbi:MAG: D-2-hydroxyacid dehydrogenase [Prevotellaceae bacterium]|nr:D-2-hydroxyacid dehydrogenase [Prevotellaceae bacterium]
MKIVVLDGYTVSHGDISWEGWTNSVETAYNERITSVQLTYYERTPDELILERLRDAEICITNKVRMTRETISQLPRLRYIGVLATGYDVVDVEAASERGIVVTNVPAYSTMSVAQMVFAHLLNVSNRVAMHADSVKRGGWEKAEDFCYSLCTLQELDGLTFGIVGLGNIGKAVSRVAQALGMRVLAYSAKDESQLREMNIEKAASVDDLFQRADVISLHCPLTASTHHLVNAELLRLVKPTAILINTARGGLVDGEALAQALNEDRLRAACLDVLEQEPPQHDNPLIGAKNCHITPHIAWATQEARRRLMGVALENVRAFLRGERQNCVNEDKLCAER